MIRDIEEHEFLREVEDTMSWAMASLGRRNVLRAAARVLEVAAMYVTDECYWQIEQLLRALDDEVDFIDENDDDGDHDDDHLHGDRGGGRGIPVLPWSPTQR